MKYVSALVSRVKAKYAAVRAYLHSVHVALQALVVAIKG